MSPLRWSPLIAVSCFTLACTSGEVPIDNDNDNDTETKLMSEGTGDPGTSGGGTGFGGSTANGTDGWDDTGYGDETGCDISVPNGCPWSNSTGHNDEWGTNGDGGSIGVASDCEAIDLGSATGTEVFGGVLDGTAQDSVWLGCNPNAGDALDMVFLWTPPGPGDYTIRASSEVFDAVLGVSDAACGADPFACSDDCSDNSAGVIVSGWQTPIRIAVEAAAGGQGAFSLAIAAGASLQCG